MTFQFVHTGVDESGALTATSPWFVLAAVLTPHPESVAHIVNRVALRTGKRLKRARKPATELKWRNASHRVRTDVLGHLAATEVQCFTLVVDKQGRRIEDSPENYAVLVCELLALCWEYYPNQSVALDRHFTTPAQFARVNTFVYRHWPATGTLNLIHVDSQRSSLVQLADFVAGAAYDRYNGRDDSLHILGDKIANVKVAAWATLKAGWLAMRQQKTEPPDRLAPDIAGESG